MSIDHLADRIRNFKIIVDGDGRVEGGFGKIPDRDVTIEHLKQAFNEFKLVGSNGVQAFGSLEQGYVLFTE